MRNKKIDPNRLITDYIKLATIEGESKLSGNYKFGKMKKTLSLT